MKASKAWKAGTVFMLCLFIAGLSTATEKSELAMEKGKLSFSMGDYKAASDMFSKVVADEPGNYEALYYLGMSELALDHPLAAAESLEKAVSLKPDALELRLDLAWAQIEARQGKSALEQINTVLSKEPENARANYLKAHALLQDKNYSDARNAFAKVPDYMPEKAQEARFYQGICSMKLKDEDSAKSAFSEAKAIDPGSELGKASADYLDALEEKPPEEKKKFEGKISLFYQTDSNVVPTADEDMLPEDVSNEEDNRYVLFAEAAYHPWISKHFDTALGAGFYNSWHEDEDLFNLQVLSGNVYGRYMGKVFNMPLTLHLGYVYQYAGLGDDYDYYSTINRIMHSIYLQEHNITLTELSFYYETEIFDDPGWDEFDRDNSAGMALAAQHFLLFNNKLDLRLGGKYIMENAKGDAYDVIRQGYLAELKLKEWKRFSGSALLDYEDRDYINHPADREDERTYYSLRVEYRIIKHLNVFVGMNQANYESNFESYDYDRTIYSFGLTGSL